MIVLKKLGEHMFSYGVAGVPHCGLLMMPILGLKVQLESRVTIRSVLPFMVTVRWALRVPHARLEPLCYIWGQIIHLWFLRGMIFFRCSHAWTDLLTPIRPWYENMLQCKYFSKSSFPLNPITS